MKPACTLAWGAPPGVAVIALGWAATLVLDRRGGAHQLADAPDREEVVGVSEAPDRLEERLRSKHVLDVCEHYEGASTPLAMPCGGNRGPAMTKVRLHRRIVDAMVRGAPSPGASPA